LSTALICGITGQDGAYLAKFLLEKGYKIWGTSRDVQIANLHKLRDLKILKIVSLVSMAPSDIRSVLGVMKHCQPDEIYYLAGQSSVGLSFEQPGETIESNTIGVLNILESVRYFEKPVKVYHASSSECFGDIGNTVATEETAFRPCSPYGIAKAAAHWLVVNYRDAYGLYACNGILFNHESPLRPERFVTRKVTNTAVHISMGSEERLMLGCLDIVRDWGWAPEYVEAMWRMLQQKKAGDYIVATGESHSLEEFVEEAFDFVGLDWKDHVDINPELFRPNELKWSRGNPGKAEAVLGWKSRYQMHDVIRMLESSLLDQLKNN